MGEDRLDPKESDTEVSSDAPSVSDDRLYRALASRQRRRLLFTLVEERTASVEEIVTLLTGWETTESGTMATLNDWETVRIQLVHNHLPLLEDAGFLTYDRDTDTVSLVPLDPVVNALLRQSVSHPPNRS